MNAVAVAMAKLAGLHKIVGVGLRDSRGLYFDPQIVGGWFEVFNRAADELRRHLPDLFHDLPTRSIPKPSATTDFDGRGYIERGRLETLLHDIDYIFEVRAHSELQPPSPAKVAHRRVFVSHGRSEVWREVQPFVEKSVGLETLELAQEPNRGRTVVQKLNEESDRCCYAVIIMTGDDRTDDGEVRARENVMHEVGFFQGKYGLANVCLLHEEGVNIPSNIHGLVYIPFPDGMISAAFGALERELRAAFSQQR